MTGEPAASRGSPRPYYGWVVVGAAFAVLFSAYGTQYSFGVFFAALLAEFDWSRSSLAGVFSLYAFAYSLLGFVAGRLTDRWGPRRVVAAGAACLGAAFAGMAAVTALWQPYVLYGVVGALGMSTAFVPCNSTVVRWFVRRRGLAVGLAGSGGSVGSLVLPPLAQILVTGIGWRAAYVVFGAGIFVVLNLVAPLLRRAPDTMGVGPDGDAAAPVATLDAGPGWSLREALDAPAFWLLGVTFTVAWLPVFAGLVHLVPFARDLGHSPLVASSVLSVTGVGAVVGRLVMGAVSDRTGRKAAVAVGLGLLSASFVQLAMARGLASVYLAAFVFGFAYGSLSALFPAIVGDFFGRERVGALVGFMFALSGAVGALGPLVAGAVYDAVGSYVPAFAGLAAANLVALATLVLARAPGPSPRALRERRCDGPVGAVAPACSPVAERSRPRWPTRDP
jgi:MFS family permease